MVKRLLALLLVVVMTITAFSLFSCTPNDDGGDIPGESQTPDDNQTPDEETPDDSEIPDDNTDGDEDEGDGNDGNGSGEIELPRDEFN